MPNPPESPLKAAYNPDVLSCLANLSNDEVFTPPELANRMLDLLPPELFRSPETTFLDPCCKSGVFLREIAKRLIEGLKDKIPDLQARVDHIFQKQLFGIAITEMTSLLARRSLYCSKYPNSRYSVARFPDAAGNIRFKVLQHTWADGRCVFCGAAQSQYERATDLETHAYEFIHTDHPERIFGNMKFDVIIGNPPYQLNDGGSGASASPLYHKFIQQAKKLNPRYLSMIVPARWYSGGKGLDEFRDEMLHDKRIRVLVDYFDAGDCFPGIDLSGGICYFLWNRDQTGLCKVVSCRDGKENGMTRPLLELGGMSFIRFNEAVPILRKVLANFKSFDCLVSARKPFGLTTTIQGGAKTEKRTIKLYSNRNVTSVPGYVAPEEIPENRHWIGSHKVLISRAYGERGAFPYFVLGKPFYSEPHSACTETYLVIGPFGTKGQCENVMTYVQTKLFRFCVLQQKNTQDSPRRVYSLVPMQDFSKPWTDAELYKKYNLTKEEIAFIESMIKPME